MRASNIIQGSIVVMKLHGVSSPSSYEKMYTWPQFLVEKQKVSYRWGGGLAQNPRGLYE